MRVLIVGAGALGGMVGALLAKAGEDVTLLESNVARARLLAGSGLFLAEGNNAEERIDVRVVSTLAGDWTAQTVLLDAAQADEIALVRGDQSDAPFAALMATLENRLGGGQASAPRPLSTCGASSKMRNSAG